jgi:hypothetical protein
LISRDILPSLEKKIDRAQRYLHWHCLDPSHDPDVWLRYYATEDERQGWQEETGSRLPPAEPAPFPRHIPRGPV